MVGCIPGSQGRPTGLRASAAVVVAVAWALLSVSAPRAAAGQSASTLSAGYRHLSLTADGRVVVYESSDPSLAPPGTGAVSQVYLWDWDGGDPRLVSVTPEGRPADGDCYAPSASRDAKRVAFESRAANLAPSAGGVSHIYVRDLGTEVLMVADASSAGDLADADSFWPSLSADGTKVAFQSWATNLVPGDTNDAPDIFLKDLASGEIHRVSVSGEGAQGNADSYFPSLSADGSRVAFESYARNLASETVTGGPAILVKDLVTGSVTLASADGEGREADGGSLAPVISGSGRHVAFQSWSVSLAPEKRNWGVPDIYVKDLATGAVSRASVSTSGREADSPCLFPSVSSDGRYAAFQSSAALTGDAVAGVPHAYVKDLRTGILFHVSSAALGREGESPATAAEAPVAAFYSGGTLHVRDWTRAHVRMALPGLLGGWLTVNERSQSGPRGDLNEDGQVTIGDVLLASQLMLQPPFLPPRLLYTADLNGDGSVSIGDVVLLLSRALGIR